MILLLKLLTAHFLGDFLLQPKSWVKDKEKKKVRSTSFYLHLMVHGFLVILLLWDFSYWALALLIMLSHGVIDLTKLYFQKKKTKPLWFLIDQGLHLISIVVIWLLWERPIFSFENFDQSTFWLYTTAIVFLTFVSGVLIQFLLSNWTKAIKDENKESLQNAGKFIGILERLFVFTFVVSGNWEAIGFLLAAKSVFRFGDLRESKDRMLTEYILIGTLLSFGIAIFLGMLVLGLLGI